MKDITYIRNKYNNICNGIIPQSVEASQMHKERVNNISWLFNGGNLRTEAEIQNKIQSLREELIIFEFAGETGLPRKITSLKLKDLEDVVN